MNKEIDELRQRVEALEEQVRELQSARRVQATIPQPQPAPAQPPYPSQLAQTPYPPQPAPGQPPYQQQPTLAQPPYQTGHGRPVPASPYPPRSEKAPTAPGDRNRDIETQVAGVWFNRIAVFLLILAALYGFKWAIDNEIIGPTGRVVIGYLAALAMLGVGKVTHDKGYRLWSLGITGGGMALLYVSTFAAYDFYHLIGYGIAFGLMVLFAAFGAVLSLYYDAVAVAWISALGGFLTPFLLYSGKANFAGLFTYVALLDIGILALAYFRKWRSLDILGLAATWIIYGLAATDYRSLHWSTFFAAATAFFVIFTAVPVLYNLANRLRASAWDLSLILVNGLVYFSAGLALLELNPALKKLDGFFAVAMALVYFLLGYVALQRSREDFALTYSFLGLSALFLTIAIPVQLTGFWIPTAWAVESLVLSWIGLRYQMIGVRYGGLVALGLAAAATVAFAEDGPVGPRLLGTMAFAATAVSLWGHVWLYNKLEAQDAKDWHKYLAVAANIWTIFWWSVELFGYFGRQVDALREQYREERGVAQQFYIERVRLDNAEAFALSTLWALYGFGLMAVGFLWRSRGARLLGIGVLGLTLAKVAFSDIWNLSGGYRVIGLFALGLVLLAASFLYFRFKDRLFSDKEAV